MKKNKDKKNTMKKIRRRRTPERRIIKEEVEQGARRRRRIRMLDKNRGGRGVAVEGRKMGVVNWKCRWVENLLRPRLFSGNRNKELEFISYSHQSLIFATILDPGKETCIENWSESISLNWVNPITAKSMVIVLLFMHGI